MSAKNVEEKKNALKGVKSTKKNGYESVSTKDDSTVKAHAKYIRTSPYKLRRVADQIRGKSVNLAFSILENLPHKGAREISKVLKLENLNNCFLNQTRCLCSAPRTTSIHLQKIRFQNTL